MMDPFTATVDTLAVYRISRFIGRDTFPPMRKARERWLALHPEEGDPAPEGGLFWLDGDPGPYRNEDGNLEQSALVVGHHPGGDPVEYAPDGQGTWTDGPRTLRAVRHVGKIILQESDPFGEVVVCPWCNSPYIALGVLAARRVAPRLWGPVAWVLAASAVAGFVAGKEG